MLKLYSCMYIVYVLVCWRHTFIITLARVLINCCSQSELWMNNNNQLTADVIHVDATTVFNINIAFP